MKLLFSLVKWFLVITLGLPLFIYFLLISLNFDDEDKSGKVIKFEQFLAKRSTPDDRHNGFVYAVGLSAKAEDDFYSVGLKRIITANNSALSSEISSPQDHLQISKTHSEFKELIAGCGDLIQFNQTCSAVLLGKKQQIDDFLARHNTLLERYILMTSQTNWYESIQLNMHNSISISPWSVGQKVFMLNAWRQAAEGKMQIAIELLQQESSFWYKAMSSTHYLTHFMLSSGLIQQNYHWENFILNHFSMNDISHNVSSNSKQSLLITPFLFDNIVIGEWKFASSVFQEAFDHEEWYSLFIRPLFKMQSTLNLYAEVLVKSAQATKHENNTVIEMCHQALSLSMLRWYSYNPIGRVLVCAGVPNFSRYQAEIMKIEKLRLATQDRIIF